MADSSPKPPTAADETRLTVDFERGIAFLVSSLGNKLSAIASNNVRRNLGVGLMEWRILALLAVEGAATPARAAKMAGVDKSVVSRAAASLEARGLITIAPDASSSRQTRLAMTPGGESIHAKGVLLAFADHETLMAGFSDAEQDQLASFLRRLHANLPQLERRAP